MATNTTSRKAFYYVNDICTAQAIDGGVRVLFCDDSTHQWGEFIASQDFLFDSFGTVEFEATDFSISDPFYRRTMVQEVNLAFQSA